MKEITLGTYTIEDVVAIVQQALISAKNPDWCPGLRQIIDVVNHVAKNGGVRVTRRLGRPKGSKNKPKPAEAAAATT